MCVNSYNSVKSAHLSLIQLLGILKAIAINLKSLLIATHVKAYVDKNVNEVAPCIAYVEV